MNFLLTDDHPLVRRGIREILLDAFSDAVIFEGDDAASSLQHLRAADIGFVILDLSLPDRHGLDCLAEIRRSNRTVPVLVLSMYAEERFALRALELGANGYLTKDRAPDEIVRAIRRIRDGGRYIGEDTAEALANRAFSTGDNQAHERLSPRELSVMRDLSRGETPSAIATRYFISVKTVSTYRTRILRKLGLRGIAEMTRYCLEHGLVD